MEEVVILWRRGNRMQCYKLAKWKNWTERTKWDLGDQDRGGNMGGVIITLKTFWKNYYGNLQLEKLSTECTNTYIKRVRMDLFYKGEKTSQLNTTPYWNKTLSTRDRLPLYEGFKIDFSQTLRVVANALGYSLELGINILLLKTPHAWDINHGGNLAGA